MLIENCCKNLLDEICNSIEGLKDLVQRIEICGDAKNYNLFSVINHQDTGYVGDTNFVFLRNALLEHTNLPQNQ